MAFDIDGDGDLDLVTGSYRLCLYLNDGRGYFANVTATNVTTVSGKAYGDIDAGDIDGDGDLDVIVADEPLRLYENLGAGRLSEVLGHFPTYSFPARPGGSAKLADLDNDGDLDLLVTEQANQPGLLILLNNGRGYFTDGTAGRMPNLGIPAYYINPVDLDGDGRIDIVGGSSYGSRVLINGGGGVFTLVFSTPTLHGMLDVVTADFDLDGDIDFLEARPIQDRMYLNYSAGRIWSDWTLWNCPATGAFPFGLIAADVDDDGDTDVYSINGGLALPKSVFQPDSLLLNDGTGRLTDVSSTRLGAPTNLPNYSPWAAAHGDIDLDGDEDLLFVQDWPLPEGITVLVNNLRQASAPQPHLGAPWPVTIASRPGFATSGETGVLYLSQNATNPPLFVPPFGSWGLAAPVVVSAPLTIPSPSGVVTVAIPIPGAASLIGTMVYGQALVGSSAGPVTGFRLTNALAETVAR